MLEISLWEALAPYWETVKVAVASVLDLIAGGEDAIRDQFGWGGLVATYAALAAVVIFVAARLFKLSFAMIKFLVAPALILAFLVTILTDIAFAAALPVTVAACSLFLVIKG